MRSSSHSAPCRSRPTSSHSAPCRRRPTAIGLSASSSNALSLIGLSATSVIGLSAIGLTARCVSALTVCLLTFGSWNAKKSRTGPRAPAPSESTPGQPSTVPEAAKSPPINAHEGAATGESKTGGKLNLVDAVGDRRWRAT